MVKISFVVPIYNVEKYVEKCIQSILDQTLKDIEIICVNDSSTDNSMTFLKEFAHQDPRIKIFCNRHNRGLSYTRNKGLNVAKGEYVWFVDSDDWITSRKAAEILYRRAQQTDLSVLMFDLENYYETPALQEHLASFEKKNSSLYVEECKGIEMFTKQMNSGDFMSTVPLYFFKRIWLINSHIRFRDNLLHEDMLFSFEIMTAAERVGYIPEKLYGYYRHTQSITTGFDRAAQKVASFAYIIAEIYSCIRTRPINEENIEAIIRYISVMKNTLIESFLLNIRNGIVIPYLRQSDQLITKLILEETFPLISKAITCEFYSRVSSAPKIIIYGAGYVSEMTRKLLNYMNINDYSVAVTKGKTKTIHEISEFKNEQVLVLIAVTKEKQKEMIDYSASLGLRDYICMG